MNDNDDNGFLEGKLERVRIWHYGNLERYEETKDWEAEDASPAQVRQLLKFGYEDLPNFITKGEAHYLLHNYKELPTPKQCRWLLKHDMLWPGLSREDVNDMMDPDNNWQYGDEPEPEPERD